MFFNNTDLTKKSDHTEQLQRKPATKAWFICAMPCENIAAHIRNQAINAIDQHALEQVIYRYLQSREHANEAHLKIQACRQYAIIFTFLFLCSALLQKLIPVDRSNQEVMELNQEFTISFLLGLMGTIGVLRSGSLNKFRYQDTENFCLTYLNQHLNDSQCQAIQNLTYQSKEHYLHHTQELVIKIIENQLSIVQSQHYV